MSTAVARPRLLLLHRRAFTLIELLVVIVILGILMAVAVPTFLRQQSKAQDSRTQQYLTTAFEAIRAGTPDTGNQYPSSTSMVSWIQQSEPELTPQRGDCLTGVTSAPVDAVLVDPSSTANSLQLCSRSQSGNVWKLTASATGAQQLLDGTLVPLTVSGNEITDATRAADVQGDGLSNDSSTGAWPATTNLVTNGGFETTATGWIGSSGSTIARDTAVAKFGSASLHVTNAGIPQTTLAASIAVSTGSTYTASVWVRGTGTAYLTYDERDGSNVHVAWYNSPVVSLTGSWQRLVITRTPAAGDTNASILITGSSSGDLWVDGAQLEQNTIATPYVEANGATASRGASRIQAPAALLDETQGWVAMRVRLEWPSSIVYPTTSPPRLWEWSDYGNPAGWMGISVGAAGSWKLTRFNSASGSAGRVDASSPAVSWPTGGALTVVGAWTATAVKISVNGAPFTSASGAWIPNLPQTLFDIGGYAYPTQGEFLWFATGKGTLTDSDAATINGWGNSDPKRASFPTTAQATMVWNGVGAAGSLK